MKTLFSAITISFFLIGYLLNAEELLPFFGLGLIFLIAIYLKTLRDKYPIYRNWFCPSYILLLGLIIVCFQTPLNVFCKIAPFTTYMSFRYSDLLTKCTYLGLVCVSSYLCGNLLNPNCRIPDTHKRTDNPVLWPWLFLMPILLSLFIVNIDITAFVSGKDYVGSGAYDRIAHTFSYFEQLLDVDIVIVTSLITYRLIKKNEIVSWKCYIKEFPVVYWVVVGGYMLLRLLSGDRGPVLYTICLIFYSYLMCTKHRFKLLYVLSIVICGALTITIIGITRGGNLDQSFSERLEAAMNKEEMSRPSILPPTQELATSINTEFIAVHAIDKSNVSYNYGKYTFYALIGSIPGSSAILTTIFGVDMRSTLSSEYITIYDKGLQYSYGLGTSPMGEFYLEFGVVGCIIGLLFLGWLYSYVNKIILGNNKYISVYMIIFALKMASIAIYIPRSSVGSCMSKALYVMLIFWVLNTFFTLFKFKPITQ